MSALEKAPIPPNFRGIIQDASELVGQNRPFFTASESNRLRTIAAYWIASATQTAATASSAWALEGDGEASLEVAAKSLAANTVGLPRALPEAVPAHTTVDMPDGTMWPTSVSMQDDGAAWIVPGFSAEWHLNSITGRWEANFEDYEAQVYEPALFGSNSGPLPFENWRIAKAPAIESLLESVPAETIAGETVLEKSGIEIEIVAPRWGNEENRGLEMEYVNAAEGPAGCPRSSASSCYWPIAVGFGTEAGSLIVANFHQLGNAYEYRDRTFWVSDPFNFEWHDKELWGYNHEGVIFGGLAPTSVPMLLYRKIPKSGCFYFPSVSQPEAGSPGCPG